MTPDLAYSRNAISILSLGCSGMICCQISEMLAFCEEYFWKIGLMVQVLHASDAP